MKKLLVTTLLASASFTASAITSNLWLDPWELETSDSGQIEAFSPIYFDGTDKFYTNSQGTLFIISPKQNCDGIGNETKFKVNGNNIKFNIDCEIKENQINIKYTPELWGSAKFIQIEFERKPAVNYGNKFMISSKGYVRAVTDYDFITR